MGHQLLCHGPQNSVSLSPGADGGWGSHIIAANLAKDQKKFFAYCAIQRQRDGNFIPSVTRLETRNEHDICP